VSLDPYSTLHHFPLSMYTILTPPCEMCVIKGQYVIMCLTFHFQYTLRTSMGSVCPSKVCLYPCRAMHKLPSYKFNIHYCNLPRKCVRPKRNLCNCSRSIYTTVIRPVKLCVLQLCTVHSDPYRAIHNVPLSIFTTVIPPWEMPCVHMSRYCTHVS
jgi:hypothetical protein